ncbi:AraC family transcriptional regulator [Amycolatopsis sp. NBC_00355]
MDAHVRRNLRDPVTVDQLAAVAGFSHSQHLSTAFRRARGSSPSQYRAAR